VAEARRKAIINLRDRRPIWRVPEWAEAAIAASFPASWQVTFIEGLADGRGDGRGVSAETLAAAPGAEIYIGFGAPPELLETANSGGATLRWIHTATAGVTSLLYPELVAADLVLTNSAGVHAPAMAETVLAMMLHFARGLDFAVRAQAAARWDSQPFEERVGAVTELDGATLGVVGLGGIGLEVAKRARPLGLKLIAIRRSNRPGPTGVELLTGFDALDRLLARADYVLIAVPDTPGTRGLIGAAAIARLKPAAVLINVARGEVLDEAALAEALEGGRLRGAALDVFRSEPLPADSPLWRLPNVLITPHVSGTTTRFWEREVKLIRDNVARYLAGRALRNVVDKRLGY
jgi:phosphoglycerate dehydrogenase-like enzyme